jgi:hypothetical protein
MWNTADVHIHASMGLCDNKELLPIKNTVRDDWFQNYKSRVLVVLAQIKTDTVTTNSSDQGLNILSVIKFYFETRNFEEMIILSCTVIGMVLSAQKEAFLVGGVYVAGVQRRNNGSSC